MLYVGYWMYFIKVGLFVAAVVGGIGFFFQNTSGGHCYCSGINSAVNLMSAMTIDV